MKKLIPLFLFVILAFVTCQNASAFTISAIPQKQEFSANDWIKINLEIDGYNGGPINWVAHRPDNSVISGIIDSQVRFGKTVHQIIRDAYDNEFGPWSINYNYGAINQTVHFNVIPLNLAVFMDKVTYYEPNIMNINITSSYYNSYAKFAKSYFLNFYDRDGNLATGTQEIEVPADRSNVLYHFPMFELSNYNPPGLYKLKVQYFNSVIEVPFLLGDIHKLMEISAQTSATYYQGSDVTIDIIFTRLTQSTATLKITDPLGNTTSDKFHPRSVHDTLVLKNFSKKIGTYKFEVHYAGTTTTGSFNVIKNLHELPNIKLEILPNKLNYRPGEIANFEIHTSEVITNSISAWVTNPDGKTSQEISLPLDTTEIIIPHKIAKNDSNGQWNLYVNYDGIVISSSFYVGGPPVEDSEVLDAVQYSVPTFVSVINSTTFKSPMGITVDSDNSTYVIDSGNSKVKKFDENGNLLLFWGNNIDSSRGQFKNPLGIFVNEKYVYVIDTGNTRINMFNKTGNFVYSWGTYGDNHGMFQMPVSINSNHNGELFVGDVEKKSIQLFDIKGTYREQIDSSLTEGASFSGIRALAFDSQDNLFAVSTDNKILKYSNIGKFLNFYSSSGTEEGRFNNPSAIAIDSKNNIYVADTDNHRIQKFDVNGNFLLSWGTEGTGQGQFEQPVGLAIDGADNIYVVDKKNNNIQKFALYGGMTKNVLPSWIKKNAMWWSEGALDKSDFALVVKYIIKQGLIQIPPTPGYGSIPENSSAKVEELKKDIQLWLSGKIDRISQTPEDSVKIPEWLKKNVQLWSTDKIDDQTFFKSIDYLLSIEIMRI